VSRLRGFRRVWAREQALLVWAREQALLAWEAAAVAPVYFFARLSCTPTPAKLQESLLQIHFSWPRENLALSYDPLSCSDSLIRIPVAGPALRPGAWMPYSTLLTFPLVNVTFMSL
jgi:hypothetical protein